MEARPHAKLGGDADLPAHGLGQALADGQAQAGAAVDAGGGSVDLGEALEQLGLLSLGEPGPGVLHRQVQAGEFGIVSHPQPHTAMVGELDRIADEIEQDLPQPAGIHHRPGRDLPLGDEVQRQALGRGLRREHQERVAGQVNRLHGPGRDLEMSGFQLGEVEHVVDDRQQRLAGR